MPRTQADSTYAVFGCTDTVCVHLALSVELAAPCSARVPEWTGLLTTEPRPPVQDQGDSVPVSNPGLPSRFAAWAGTVATRTPAAAAAVTARAASRCLDRFMMGASGRELLRAVRTAWMGTNC